MIVNVCQMNANVSFRPSFETYRRYVDLLLCGSNFRHFFHSRTVHLDIIKVFYLPTDAQ